MIVDEHKLIYQPIAKNACSSTKRLVADIGGFNLKKVQGGIHHTLDSQNTGLQFKDRTDDEITIALNDPSWMRFVIYRDPLDRLVSAYVEKFVQKRSSPREWKTTTGVIQAIFHKEEPTEEDFEHGVTFREFAEYILAENPAHLNSHWQPQTFYLGNIPFTHMYDIKALDRLETDLQDHVGKRVKIPRRNVSRGKQSEAEYLSVAPDLLPRDLGDAKNLTADSFLAPDLLVRLTEYYAADISIYRLVQSVSGPVTSQS